MTNNGDYPMGAKYDSNAPYNQKDKKPLEMEVTISQTLSKTVKVLVYDYYEDEEGYTECSECDLEKAVQDCGITTPYDLVKDSGWNLDEYEVVED